MSRKLEKSTTINTKILYGYPFIVHTINTNIPYQHGHASNVVMRVTVTHIRT